jgi:hypothetical protein
MKMENKINEERVGNQHSAKRENKETFRERENERENRPVISIHFS